MTREKDQKKLDVSPVINPIDTLRIQGEQVAARFQNFLNSFKTLTIGHVTGESREVFDSFFECISPWICVNLAPQATLQATRLNAEVNQFLY